MIEKKDMQDDFVNIFFIAHKNDAKVTLQSLHFGHEIGVFNIR